MKITTITAALAATVATSGAVGIIGAPIAFAETATQTIGSEGKLVDGNVIQAWTISDLKPSTDVIPLKGKRARCGKPRQPTKPFRVQPRRSFRISTPVHRAARRIELCSEWPLHRA